MRLKGLYSGGRCGGGGGARAASTCMPGCLNSFPFGCTSSTGHAGRAGVGARAPPPAGTAHASTHPSSSLTLDAWKAVPGGGRGGARLPEPPPSFHAAQLSGILDDKSWDGCGMNAWWRVRERALPHPPPRVHSTAIPALIVKDS